ncbi:DNA alkylation repair protein [Amycolatopsis stemonae]
MSADEQLVKAIRTGLAELADPVKATAMQAYMKSAMPFRGVASPERSAFLKGVLADHIVPDRVKYSATVLELWRTAEFREERYAAIALSGHRAYRRWQDPDLVPMYEEMIVSGAWWDYVDELAIRRIGPILRSHRPELTRLMLRWAADHDLWRRRTAIICQVGAKEETDTDLLVRAIEPAIAEPEFFLRKGIGWALREYAKTSPDWVRSFVDDHPGLSGLSRREALKHIG